MSVGADQTGPETKPSMAGPAMVAVGVGCLVAAGAVLWWRQGDAVFSDMVLAALAWCF